MTERHDQMEKMMPEYSFECDTCREAVTIKATVEEKEHGLSCPNCGGTELSQIFTPISTISGCDSSPTKAPG